ncbi:MAG TPA: glycosyltransferase [Verrucomicrobiae bacterium]|nr:glycosyltransferase [Verrucomicrobiae bacterium]
MSPRYTIFWTAYGRVYFVLLVAYIWYVFILMYLGERGVRKTVTYSYHGESIAVLMPVYNEEPRLFLAALQSIIRCEGNKTIFVLDDGTTKQFNRKALQAICDRDGVRFVSFPKNRGKRHVLHDGVKLLDQQYDYVVTIDSDTVLDKEALVNIVGVFGDPKIGAACGNVRAINERENWLTRMQGSYYWAALEICKAAQSTIGMVACCSGCLSAYRNTILDQVIDEYVNERFLGEPCNHSEDRHLTNLVLREGYKVKYVSSAISYTHTPNTMKGFLKQQLRWRRGFIQEATFLLTFAWRKHKALFLQTLLYDLTMPFLTVGFAISTMLLLIRSPGSSIPVALVTIMLITCIRNLPLIFRKPQKIPGMIAFTIISDLVLYWQNIYALFTTKKKGWLTR